MGSSFELLTIYQNYILEHHGLPMCLRTTESCSLSWRIIHACRPNFATITNWRAPQSVGQLGCHFCSFGGTAPSNGFRCSRHDALIIFLQYSPNISDGPYRSKVCKRGKQTQREFSSVLLNCCGTFSIAFCETFCRSGIINQMMGRTDRTGD